MARRLNFTENRTGNREKGTEVSKNYLEQKLSNNLNKNNHIKQNALIFSDSDLNK